MKKHSTSLVIKEMQTQITVLSRILAWLKWEIQCQMLTRMWKHGTYTENEGLIFYVYFEKLSASIKV